MSRGELYQRVGHCACRHSAVAVAAAAVAAVTRAASRLTDHTRCLRTNGTGVDWRHFRFLEDADDDDLDVGDKLLRSLRPA